MDEVMHKWKFKPGDVVYYKWDVVPYTVEILEYRFNENHGSKTYYYKPLNPHNHFPVCYGGGPAFFEENYEIDVKYLFNQDLERLINEDL